MNRSQPADLRIFFNTESLTARSLLITAKSFAPRLRSRVLAAAFLALGFSPTWIHGQDRNQEFPTPQPREPLIRSSAQEWTIRQVERQTGAVRTYSFEAANDDLKNVPHFAETADETFIANEMQKILNDARDLPVPVVIVFGNFNQKDPGRALRLEPMRLYEGSSRPQDGLALVLDSDHWKQIGNVDPIYIWFITAHELDHIPIISKFRELIQKATQDILNFLSTNGVRFDKSTDLEAELALEVDYALGAKSELNANNEAKKKVPQIKRIPAYDSVRAADRIEERKLQQAINNIVKLFKMNRHQEGIFRQYLKNNLRLPQRESPDRAYLLWSHPPDRQESMMFLVRVAA